MKRSELVVGAELFHSTSRNNDFGQKVVVVSVEPHEYSSYSARIRQTTKGGGVLVEVPYTTWNGGGSMQKVVQLQSLIGDYATIQSAIDAERVRKAEVNRNREIYNETVVYPARKALMDAIKSTEGVGALWESQRFSDLSVATMDALTAVILAGQKALANA